MREREMRRPFDGIVTGVGIGTAIGGVLFLVGTSGTFGTLLGVVFTIAGVLTAGLGIAALRTKRC